jgi:cysteine desulfurase
LGKSIFMDNASTTKPCASIYKYLMNNNEIIYGNPSSLHKQGVLAETEMKKTRETLAGILSCKPGEIIFTSGGTESNNLAVMGYLQRNKHSGKKIITTRQEHLSVLNTIKKLETKDYEIVYIENDKNGYPDIESLNNLIDSNTALVSIMHVNNETGSINDIEKAGNIIKARNKKCVFHVDGIQGFLKIPVDFKKSYIDMYSISGHKFHALKGTGALFIKNSIKISGLFQGGSQEEGKRPGTENLPGIISMRLAAEEFPGNAFNKSVKIKKILEAGIKKIPDSRIIKALDSSPYILSAAFPGIPSESMLHSLEEEGIYISSGSACSAKKKNNSHVLESMNLEKGIIESTVRFSFSYTNTLEETENVLKVLGEKISILKKIYKKR